MPKIELLAPAKDKDIALAAINYGADAVYMGGPSFGARRQAANSLADIARVVEYAHAYGARVYLTVNTLLHDDELNDARRLIDSLYEIGADALIVQDMGLLTEALPPIAVHASTQMHTNTPEKLRFLAQIGVKRAVLPREFSLAEIRAMADAVPEIELETFIHGALCVSYSGQCYLSYAVGGRSANRGECAQPCRKLYSLQDVRGKVLVQDKYLLSLKDLCLAEYLADMLAAGVTSFKIEGRLKNINYVKNTVAFYRQKIDALLSGQPAWQKASSGTVYFDFVPSIHKTFNRLYTDYFINGRQKDLIQFDTPKALGESLGTVRHSRAGIITLDAPAGLGAGDGLCWLAAGRLQGANVNQAGASGIALQNVDAIASGTEVFRNYDHNYNKLLDNSRTYRKVAFNLQVAFGANLLILRAHDEDGVTAEMHVNEDFAVAKDAALAKANLLKAFTKQGDTVFALRDFTADGALPFMPMSRLNALRREFMDTMLQKRLQFFWPVPTPLTLGTAEFPVKTLDFRGNVINANAAKFYASHGAQVAEPGAESGLDMRGKPVMMTKHCLRYSLGLCGKPSANTPLWLVDDKGRRFELVFDCIDCVMRVVFSSTL